MTTYFTADSHWGHRKIIQYSNRPFASVEEMNEAMIERWNDTVGPDDTVYHLGDVAFLSPGRTSEIVNRLNGTIHLSPGNHDSDAILKLGRWASVEHYRDINLDGHKIIMLHYGMRVWDRSHRGALMLYGHSHGSLAGTSQSLDVGVDCWDYRPVSLPEIKARMATLPQYSSGDHHV